MSSANTSNPIQPVVLSKKEIDELPVIGFPEPGRMVGGFQNIFTKGATPTNELSFGTARLPAKTDTQTSFLALHRHEPAEFYFIISGHMHIMLEGVEHQASAGHAIYIPGNAEHGYCNPSRGEDLVFVWGYGLDGFDGMEFRWSTKTPDWAAIVDW